MEILIMILMFFYAILGFSESSPEFKEGQMDIAREQCFILSEILPPAIGKFGGNFDFGDLVKEFEKDSRVRRTYEQSEDEECIVDIYNKYDKYGDYGGDRIRLYFERTPDCEISKKNCYAYLKPKSDDIIYSCRFYFDGKGRVTQSKWTTQFINEKERQE